MDGSMFKKFWKRMIMMIAITHRWRAIVMVGVGGVVDVDDAIIIIDEMMQRLTTLAMMVTMVVATGALLVD